MKPEDLYDWVPIESQSPMKRVLGFDSTERAYFVDGTC